MTAAEMTDEIEEDENEEPEMYCSDGCGGCFREPVAPHSGYCLQAQKTERCPTWSFLHAAQCDRLVAHKGRHFILNKGYWDPIPHSER